MIRSKTHPLNMLSFAVMAAALIAAGCGGDAPANDAATAQDDAPAADAPAAGEVVAVGEASLSIGGGPVVYPGRYPLTTSCVFDDGIVMLRLATAGSSAGGPGMATVAASDAAEAFAEGTYSARFDITENHEDGNVERFVGAAEIEVVGIDQGVATIEVTGENEEGVSLDLTARCEVPAA